MKEFIRDCTLHYEGLINSEMAKELRRERALRNVTELELKDSGLGPEGLKVFTEVRALWEIRKLTLARANLGDKGAAILASAKDLQELKALSLEGNGIGDDGAVALATSSSLPKLETLDLRGNPIGPKGITALRESPYLAHVHKIYLDDETLEDKEPCESRPLLMYETEDSRTKDDLFNELKKNPGNLRALSKYHKLLGTRLPLDLVRMAFKATPEGSLFGPWLEQLVRLLPVEEQMEYALEGKRLKSIWLEDGETNITIEIEDVGFYEISLEAHCCSVSYVADIVGTENIGSKVTGVEELGFDRPYKSDEKPSQRQEVIKPFGFRIMTETGPIDFVCRNESNGYYSGYIGSFWKRGVFTPAFSTRITEDYSF